ncbi:MAG: hypothetical protein J5643_07870 [Lachnospiraceae bacterium]|nr:hypothetical protein [Lachnospiraceae bacterium]
MKKVLMLLLLLLVCCLSFSACGEDDDDDRSSKKSSKKTESTKDKDEDDDDDDEDDPTPTPEGVTIASTETWGDLTVGVPEGWTFRKGDALDDDDTRYCSVKKSDFSFFDFKMESEELAKQHYEYNKNTYTNEQTDVSGTYGSIAWAGFQYSDGWGGYGFELYAVVNEKPVRVSCCGFKFDSEEAKTILGSMIIK